jgi:dihydroneopterin triphosphate aldolase (PTPS-III) / 6-pyruvoyltetrahydropterin synthase
LLFAESGLPRNVAVRALNMKSSFSIHVAKENLKFSAAHFIAYPGFREPLHGHNYQVGVRVEGRLAKTGYVLDFGLVKKLVKQIVDRLDERTLVPMNSDCLKIDREPTRVRIRYEDDEFVIPASDACLLPIVHSSAEELACYIFGELRDALKTHAALNDVVAIEISVAEGPGQAAIYSEQL